MTDVALEPRKPGRPRKYANDEEAREANRASARVSNAKRRERRLEMQARFANADLRDPEVKRAIAEEVARINAKRRGHKVHQQPLINPKARTGKIAADEIDVDLRGLVDADLANVASALQYVRDVLSKKIPACLFVRQACKRSERDFARIGHADFPYVFDGGAAERVCKAVQLFPEIKGPRANRRLRLAAWQRFVIVSAFGWKHRDTGARRFRQVICFVPRGNGKTTMAAPLGLYMFSLDREGGAEVYAAAVTRQQARLVFDTASFMAQREATYRAKYGVEVAAHAIMQQSTASTFRALSRDASSMDGLNVHFAILDELAQHKNRDVFDVLMTATAKRLQSMVLMISTAGSNQSTIGYEQWQQVEKILNGDIVDESVFGIIYTIDKKDDWTKPEVWAKANPNWGVSVMPDVIEQLCKRAQQVGSQQMAFLQKHLNVWTNADVAWMNMRSWNAQADPDLKIENFKGEECVLGLDLAAKIDLACKAKLFRKPIDGVLHYYVFIDSFIPEAALSDGRNDSYATWEQEGWLRASPGEVNDFNMIESSVRDDGGLYSIVDVAYDPWQALQMATNLDDAGVSVIEYRPTTANFSPAMKEIDALTREGRLHHDGNPVLAWCVSCVRIYEDRNGNIFPRKDKNDPRQKIDALVALLMAYGRWMTLDATEITPSIS